MTNNSRMISKAIEDLPSLPTSVANLLIIMSQDDYDMADIIATVDKDPGLTTQVINRSNSAFFGFVRKADTVEDATPRLGRSGLLELVLSDHLGKMCTHLGQTGESLWRHSMSTALIARKLAEHLKYDDPSLAYTAGLMHDVGKLAISHSFTGEVVEVVRLVQKMQWRVVESEREVFGFDHTELGALIAKRWHLSKKLAVVAADHHQLNKLRANRKLGMLVAMANDLAKNCGAASYAEQVQIPYDPAVLFDLNLTAGNVVFLENEATELIAEAADLIKLG